uniref:Prefoldin subunit 2 n=2 Tax=Vitis vinifera TaxID=29760 RepID=F6HDQ6_VITVI
MLALARGLYLISLIGWGVSNDLERFWRGGVGTTIADVSSLCPSSVTSPGPLGCWHLELQGPNISDIGRPRNDFEHRLSNRRNFGKMSEMSAIYRFGIDKSAIKLAGERRAEQQERMKKNVEKSPIFSKNRVMAGKAGGDLKEPVNEQAVANIYGAMRAELNQIYSKITELEMEVSEHSLVIGAIQPLDPSRRCYRMIGGVLVERTIKEVLPAVQRNKEGLEEVISRLNEALEKKKKEIAEFEAKYKIRIRKSDGEVKDENEKKEGSAQGVLVGPASTNE